MYPTAAEGKVLQAAEKLMETTMARYDPSHDAFHGQKRFSAVNDAFLMQATSSRSSARPQDRLVSSTVRNPYSRSLYCGTGRAAARRVRQEVCLCRGRVGPVPFLPSVLRVGLL